MRLFKKHKAKDKLSLNVGIKECSTCDMNLRCEECVYQKENENIKSEIERLKSELSNTRRKALLEASSKFAGHSNYHGDDILEKLTCMAEGQEVGKARPLDMSDLRELVGEDR